MSDSDSQFGRWLSERAPTEISDDVMQRTMTEIRTTPQQRSELAAGWIRGIAAAGVMGLAVIIGLAIADGRLGLVGAPPSDTPSLSPSASEATARPTPDVSPTATESPSARPSPAVSGWIQGPGTCVDPDLGFSVPIPVDWFANERDNELAPCGLFNPEAIEIEDPADPPSVAIRLMLAAAGSEFGFVTEEEVVDEQDLTIDGLPARRYLTEGFNGPRIYYLIGIEGSMPSDTNRVEYIIFATYFGEPSIAEDSHAIDEIALGFVLDR